MARKFKTLNGKRYYFQEKRTSKTGSQAVAQKWRNKPMFRGRKYNARVIKEGNYYSVYTRQVQRRKYR